MANKELNTWIEKISQDAGIKSSIILSGNTKDLYFDREDNGKYNSLSNILKGILKKCGYNKLMFWDRVTGIDYSISDTIDIAEAASSDENDYDMGSDFNVDNQDDQRHTYPEPGEFFPYMLDCISKSESKNAFILDYSDYLFGNANSLSEAERQYLVILGKTLEKSQNYDTLDADFKQVRNIIILITKNDSLIPPAFYLNNSLVSKININLPGANERKNFLDNNKTCLKLSQNINDSKIMDDLLLALDGFTLKEIFQLMKLSQQNSEAMTFEKLINLFKYGEKRSPWEELPKEKLENIEEELKKRVKGQDEAVEKVKDVIIRAYTGFSGLQHSAKQKKPKGTLFFVGPTGVGKTELAKALAQFVFGDEDACIRFDMSEYNHEQSDQRLVGAPPGYVGYEAGGQLTNAVKEKPFSVILFDEIEKAHGRILDKFLQILEDGRLTDGKGETISFSETIIIFTSNIGAAEVDPLMGKMEVQKTFIEKVKQHFITELKRPELLNRIGNNIVAFNFISEPAVFTQIAKTKFSTVISFVKEKYKAKLEFEDETKAFGFIAAKAGKANGGRGLLNTIESYIVNPLSEWIFMRMDILEGRTIRIKLDDILPNNISFDFELI